MKRQVLKNSRSCGELEQIFKCPLCHHLMGMRDAMENVYLERLRCRNCRFMVYLKSKKIDDCLVKARFVTTSEKRRWWGRKEKQGYWRIEN